MTNITYSEPQLFIGRKPTAFSFIEKPSRPSYRNTKHWPKKAAFKTRVSLIMSKTQGYFPSSVFSAKRMLLTVYGILHPRHSSSSLQVGCAVQAGNMKPDNAFPNLPLEFAFAYLLRFSAMRQTNPDRWSNSRQC